MNPNHSTHVLNRCYEYQRNKRMIVAAEPRLDSYTNIHLMDNAWDMTQKALGGVQDNAYGPDSPKFK